MTPSPPARGFNWSNLGVRVLSGVILAPGVIYCAFLGGWVLMGVIVLAVALIAREWASMCAPAAPARIAAAVTVAVLAAATTGQLGHYRIAWIVLVLAAGGCARLLVAQRSLSTPVRELRRRTVSLTGEQRLADGSIVPLDPVRLAAPMERALQSCALAMVLLATGMVLSRL